MSTVVSFNGTEIYTESFGSKDDPAILLIMGAASSMIWWEEEFCKKLSKRGFFVIRYDNRDTGKSTTYEPLKPGYTLSDMAEDAIHILDAYSIEKAVIMGMSLGGMLTQLIAVKYPQRVNAIVLLASLYISKEFDNLLKSPDDVNELFSQFANFNPKDEDELLEFAFKQSSTTNKSNRPHDEKHIREMIKLDIKRARDYNSRINHFFVKPKEEEMNMLLKINEINVPALVVHGTKDVVVPYAQGKMLAKTIPGAVLYTMEGAGHEINALDYDGVIDKICGIIIQEVFYD